MNLTAKNLQKVLKILEDFRIKAEALEEDAKRSTRTAAAQFHEGRCSAFKETIDVVRQEFELDAG